MMSEVHWYTLRRATPVFHAADDNDWPTDATSCEAALLLLESKAAPGYRLEQCRDDDGLAEFYLDKRQRLVTDCGSQPGELIASYPVRRVQA